MTQSQNNGDEKLEVVRARITPREKNKAKGFARMYFDGNLSEMLRYSLIHFPRFQKSQKKKKKKRRRKA